MTFSKKLLALALLALAAQAAPARALDIVLSNDDGFESSMLHALYQRLKQGGHRVLISAPAMEMSGTGGALSVGPVGPLATASRAGSIAAGAPGVGTLASDADVFYVNSTPAVSVLHGIDVAAKKRWKKAPDLVIAGPNNGHNIGVMSVHSGTFNAAMTALGRGIPAIAVSAGNILQAFRSFTALTPDAAEFEVADLVGRLVNELVRTRSAESARLLPVGVGLNMNVPDFLPGVGSTLRFEFSNVGTTVFTMPTFVENLAVDPVAVVALGFPPALPGVTANLTGVSPPLSSRIDDNDPSAEQTTILRGSVAVSVVQVTHQADDPTTKQIRGQLGSLLNRAAAPATAPTTRQSESLLPR